MHPQSPDAIDYWKRNKDWRGRASFFRDGYNYSVSTQNFNHTAAMGALLGGAMIGSDHAMADGRHGLETLPLRFWGFLDGSTQEMLDHYYLSITLSGQKMFADFAPTPIDRLMGRILVDRTMELLITTYHSRLRRFVSSSGRARISGVLVEQDGIFGALHTVSKDGALIHLDRSADATAQGMPVWGYDFPPGRVGDPEPAAAVGAVWMAGLIDDKPVPFEETAAETTRGNFKPPLWRRSWLGRWHGLASADIRGGTVDVMAQWVRAPQKADAHGGSRHADPALCRQRTRSRETRMAGASAQAGLPLTFQSRNRAIVFAKPHGNRERFLDAFDKGAQGHDLAARHGDRPVELRRREGLGGLCRRQEGHRLPAPLDGQPAHPDPRRRQLSRDPADRRRPISAATPRSRSRPAAAGKARAEQRGDRAGAHHLDVQPAASRAGAARLARPQRRITSAHLRRASCWSWATPSSTAASTPSPATSTANTLTATWQRGPAACSRSPTGAAAT